MMWLRKISVFIMLQAVLLLSAAPAFAQYNAFKDPTASAASSAAAGADFKAVTEAIQGGKVAVGATAYVVVLFKNQGATSVKVGNINLYPSSTVAAQVTLNQCADAPLATDAQCAITLAIKGLQSGSWRVEVLVDHSGRARIATASITGDVEMSATKQESGAKMDIEMSPSSLDFGTSSGGISLIRSIVLSNRSAAALKIRDITLNAPEQSGFSYKSKCPETLSAEESCNVIMTWLPTTKGMAQGILVVNHSGKSGMAQSEVKGLFQPPSSEEASKSAASGISVSPDSLDFGTSAGGTALIRSVVVTNHASEDVELWDIFMSAAEQSGFSYESQCPETLQPEETCSVIVTWLPTSKGLAQGVLTVDHSGLRGMSQVELKGTYQAGDLKLDATGQVDLSPSSLDFGISPGGIALVRSAVVSNHSAEDVELWDVHMNVPDQSGLSYESQCPETLQPEETCNIIVTWLPTSKGLAQGVLVVEHSGKSGMSQAELKGTLQSTGDASKDSVGQVESSPDSLDFGTSPGGIALVRSVILSNSSTDVVAIKDIVLNVSEQSGFSFQSQCPESLLPGKSCNVVVSWLPTSRGLAQGILVVQHSGKDGMTQVEVKGTLTPDAVKSATVYPEAAPDKGLLVSDKENIDFGSGIKTESAITITLVNTGNSDLMIRDVKLALGDSDLSISDSGCKTGVILKPVEACPLTLTWLPSRPGAVLDSLQISHTGTRGVLVIPVRGSADAAAQPRPVTYGTDMYSTSSGGGSSSSSGGGSGGGRAGKGGDASGIKKMLGGYTITSHSLSRAVINGPTGSLVVRDGEDVVLMGIKTTVTIVSSGVILSTDNDEVMLTFDRSLRLLDQAVSGAGGTAAASSPLGALFPPPLPTTVQP